jgi:hypothetical protein
MLIISLIISGCSWFKTEPKEDPDFDRYEQLAAVHRTQLDKLQALRHPETTWPTTDCDGWIWAAKAVAAGTQGIDLDRSKYPGEPGKYGRRPAIAGLWCYQDGGAHGSDSSWSADMFKCGMLIHALQTSNRRYIEPHRAYGRDHGWQMGEPAGSDRVWYKPNIRGWLSRAIEYLGGVHDDDALIPDIYISGLTDYQAHLQMCGIWAAGEMEGSLLPSQIERIKEHFTRSDETLFYSYMYGRWISGDIDPLVDVLIAADRPIAGEYVRCDGEPGCQLAEKAWVASLILRDR